MLFLLVAINLFIYIECQVLYQQPEQVHISIGNNASEMYVSWVTMNDTKNSFVQYGLYSLRDLNLKAVGSSSKFVDGGSQKRTMFIHRVKLTNLKADTVYTYNVGSNSGWSDIFFFKTWRTDPNWSPRFAIYGDMGNSNAQSLARLQQETRKNFYDAILHVGDFAYDMDSDNARVGDQFMRQIESIAAYVPYMTCPGNHEQAYNFSNYRFRFGMPRNGDGESIYYSYDVGPVHIISFSTEVYFYLQYGTQQIRNQFAWLEQDLIKANKNRAERPWIVTMAHRPMYCSNNDNDDCSKYESIIRTGLPYLGYGLEDLFYQYGVDVMIWAHEHSYERLWPIYDRTVCNGSLAQPYIEPGAPIHITTGSAGCRERHDGFIPIQPYMTAFRSDDYGYTRMQFFNSSHAYFEQVSDDKKGEIIDKTWIVKSKHGIYSYADNSGKCKGSLPENP
ncbi:DgyrCDS7428 [Dimorphilus gyrociliatus]|uniref:Purple acid phosphatase n=1 Tax=Dimorphilus gyrociliatus TaxID=2664684 RepID=A0A7I8VTL6_9ANNE|nr:DgyrCDS7428 [Dimorphilus gyrociliatus]